jgi:hypothetical protein
MFDESIKGLEGKDLSTGSQDHLFHIFPAHAEPSPTDTGDDFKFKIIRYSTIMNSVSFALKKIIEFFL